jgi:hypothetical protein
MGTSPNRSERRAFRASGLAVSIALSETGLSIMSNTDASPLNSAYEFALSVLRKEPGLGYQELKRMAGEQGFTLPPILYGRAKKELGIATTPPAPTIHTRPERSEPAAQPPVPAATDIVKPGRSKNPAFEYAMQALRANPAAVYRDLKAHCDAQGWKLPPILFGRAKALLGLVPVRPRRTKQEKLQQAQAAPRSLKQVETAGGLPRRPAEAPTRLDGVRSLEHLITTVKEIDAERNRLRTVLQQVLRLLEDALE